MSTQLKLIETRGSYTPPKNMIPPPAPTFARELEREKAMKDAELAALRKDKERLDWLEARGEPQTYEDAPHSLVWYVLGEDGERNLRAAIDAARAKETKS